MRLALSISRLGAIASRTVEEKELSLLQNRLNDGNFRDPVIFLEKSLGSGVTWWYVLLAELRGTEEVAPMDIG